MANLPFDLGIGLTIVSFFLALAGLWLLLRSVRARKGLSRVREVGRERGLDDLGLSLLETVAAQAAERADEVLRSEEFFDTNAECHLRALVESGIDPRETAKDLVLVKRELGFENGLPAPALLARVILGHANGSGAGEGRLVGVGGEEFDVAIGAVFQGLRRGAILEIVFADGQKMAGLAAVVRQIEEHGSFVVVRLASPEQGGFRKREHFRIDTKIATTVLVRSDQVAYMPGDGGAGFRVLSADLVNLSGGGGRLRLPFAINAGDRLCLSFALDSDGKPFGTEGKVVWAKKEEGGIWSAGFEFEGMDAENLRRLLLYLFAKKSEHVNRSSGRVASKK